jgi:hypothetical protein
MDSLTLWLFNIAMENGPFIDGLPIKNGDYPCFPQVKIHNYIKSPILNGKNTISLG